jgi:hypothetical protein
MARMTTITRASFFAGTPESPLYDCQMKIMLKNRNRLVRSPAKLAIPKDKLRVVPQDRLAEVSGGDPSSSTDPHPNWIGSWY